MICQTTVEGCYTSIRTRPLPAPFMYASGRTGGLPAAFMCAPFLVTSTRTQKPRVTVQLTQVFPQAPAGEGERVPAPDWDLVQESHAVLLETSAAEVRRTDKVHRLNKVKLSESRRGRNVLVGVLRETPAIGVPP